MRLVYRVAITTGALVLLTLFYPFSGRERNPSYQTPPKPATIISIASEPNVNLKPPLSIDEECLSRNVMPYLEEMNSPLVSFGAGDGRTEGFYISQPAEYGSRFIKAAEKCQKLYFPDEEVNSLLPRLVFRLEQPFFLCKLDACFLDCGLVGFSQRDFLQEERN